MNKYIIIIFILSISFLNSLSAINPLFDNNIESNVEPSSQKIVEKKPIVKQVVEKDSNKETIRINKVNAKINILKNIKLENIKNKKILDRLIKNKAKNNKLLQKIKQEYTLLENKKNELSKVERDSEEQEALLSQKNNIANKKTLKSNYIKIETKLRMLNPGDSIKKLKLKFKIRNLETSNIILEIEKEIVDKTIVKFENKILEIKDKPKVYRVYEKALKKLNKTKKKLEKKIKKQYSKIAKYRNKFNK